MTILPEVRAFVEQHSITELRVPNKDCPKCHRTLVAEAVYLTGERGVVWQMKCPTHRRVYGVDATP